MPRTIVKTRAIVLRTLRMGETSSLVTLYAQECGKLKAMARGSRKPKSRFGAALGLMTEVQAVCYIKETRDLQTLSECTLLRPAPDLSQSLERLSFGSAACELVDRLTIEGEGNPRLYQCLAGVLHGLAEVEPAQGRIAVLVLPATRRRGPRLPSRVAPVHYLPTRTGRLLVVVQRGPSAAACAPTADPETECA